MNDKSRIAALLKKAGFKNTDDGDYANDYVCVCMEYQKEGETIIVDNKGNIIEQLPTNYYAMLGWLLHRRMASIFILD